MVTRTFLLYDRNSKVFVSELGDGSANFHADWRKAKTFPTAAAARKAFRKSFPDDHDYWSERMAVVESPKSWSI